ncbi:LLM class flavin-dependent oxidoreductase [Cellulomonas sp. JZ18]|uniref:LLM class flavin-dependent oxidoreductase n=1 Tax=Cellulomonas sp. JZ18 TaxID=2654191 RepID=UPI0012D3CC9C|nr:LLM class flavin-dependent oxidoreductase [Cellulomonas sp. JZ18]QGQ18412.1 LLM class flavin-dependent oxidoreductase [Cellulomonas sp. JZ18]
MAQPVLARTRAPHVPAAPASSRVEVAGAAPAPGAVELRLDAATLTGTGVALAASRADVVRLVHSAALPTPASVRALVAVLEDGVHAVGRARSDVRLVLEVDAVVAADEDDAARRRERIAYAEAFSGATWAATATWLVAPVTRLVAEAAALAARTGVDAVALALVGASAAHAPAVAAAASAG